MQFSVSATTRAPRGKEEEGKDYFFLTEAEFRQKIAEDSFVEYEEVYAGTLYGTLKSAVESVAKDGIALLDIDVKGGQNVKRIYGDKSLVIFVKPPSLEILESRLRNRGTDVEASIQKRLARAAYEMQFADQSDVVIVNDDLDKAVQETIACVQSFLSE